MLKVTQRRAGDPRRVERVIIGLVAAVVSAVCYGIASVLQAAAARTEPDRGGVDARLLTRLARNSRFVVGLGLDGIAFLCQFLALQFLAVFVVQAVQAGNLAVTAVAAIPVLGARLSGREWAAIGGVCGGLVLLAFAAGAERATPVGGAVQWGFMIAAVAVVALGFLVGRLRGAWVPVALGFVSGLGFGVVALSARVITNFNVLRVLTNPALYALLLSGAAAFLFYTTGLQRHGVTSMTAAVIVGETLLPAVVGVVVLGDGTRPGAVPLAVVGFLVSIAGAVLLARFGEPVAEKPAEPAPVPEG
jgi:drug/metabolite transporter (DMT)-like permease